MKKSINYILLPLYKLWHKVVEKFKATDSGLELDGSLLINGKPVQVALVVNNIKEMTDEEIDGLKVGDVVAKKTGDMYHCYVVSYKEEHHGICLTYVDASVAETQSYDYTEGHWVYNSEDKTDLGGHTDAEIKALAKEEVESASSGTIVDSLGLNADGELVKGAISSGTKLYHHKYYLSGIGFSTNIDFISSRSTPYTLDELKVNADSLVYVCSGWMTNPSSNYGISIRKAVYYVSTLYVVEVTFKNGDVMTVTRTYEITQITTSLVTEL